MKKFTQRCLSALLCLLLLLPMAVSCGKADGDGASATTSTATEPASTTTAVTTEPEPAISPTIDLDSAVQPFAYLSNYLDYDGTRWVSVSSGYYYPEAPEKMYTVSVIQREVETQAERFGELARHIVSLNAQPISLDEYAFVGPRIYVRMGLYSLIGDWVDPDFLLQGQFISFGGANGEITSCYKISKEDSDRLYDLLDNSEHYGDKADLLARMLEEGDEVSDIASVEIEITDELTRDFWAERYPERVQALTDYASAIATDSVDLLTAIKAIGPSGTPTLSIDLTYGSVTERADFYLRLALYGNYLAVTHYPGVAHWYKIDPLEAASLTDLCRNTLANVR